MRISQISHVDIDAAGQTATCERCRDAAWFPRMPRLQFVTEAARFARRHKVCAQPLLKEIENEYAQMQREIIAAERAAGAGFLRAPIFAGVPLVSHPIESIDALWIDGRRVH